MKREGYYIPQKGYDNFLNSAKFARTVGSQTAHNKPPEHPCREHSSFRCDDGSYFVAVVKHSLKLKESSKNEFSEITLFLAWVLKVCDITSFSPFYNFSKKVLCVTLEPKFFFKKWLAK